MNHRFQTLDTILNRVDITAGEQAVERIKETVRRTYRPEVIGDIGAFGALFEMPTGYRRPVMVGSTDGVKDYFDLIDHNVAALAKALGAPSR